jgi:membrane-associated phospholipid phosphatase
VTMPRGRLVAGLVVLGVLFVALAWFVAGHPGPTAFDRAVDPVLLARPGSFSFELFRVIAVTGSVAAVAVLAIVLAFVVWMRSRDTRLVVVCFVAVGLAGVAEAGLKPIVGRPRPPTMVFTGESGYGFPSGHTTGATALAVVAVLTILVLVPRGRARTIAVASAAVYAVLIGVSRVVVGAHYATDVIGGLLLGIVVAITVTVLVRASSTTKTEAQA